MLLSLPTPVLSALQASSGSLSELHFVHSAEAVHVARLLEPRPAAAGSPARAPGSPSAHSAAAGEASWGSGPAGSHMAAQEGSRPARQGSPDDVVSEADVEALRQAIAEADAVSAVSQPPSYAATPATSPEKVPAAKRLVQALSPRKSKQQQLPVDEAVGAGIGEQKEATAAGPGPAQDVQAVEEIAAGSGSAKHSRFPWRRNKSLLKAQRPAISAEGAPAAAPEQQMGPAGGAATQAGLTPAVAEDVAMQAQQVKKLSTFDPRRLLGGKGLRQAAEDANAAPAAGTSYEVRAAGLLPAAAAQAAGTRQEHAADVPPADAAPGAGSSSSERAAESLPATAEPWGLSWQQQESRIPQAPRLQEPDSAAEVRWQGASSGTPPLSRRDSPDPISSILEATPEDYERLQRSSHHGTADSKRQPSFSRSPIAQPQWSGGVAEEAGQAPAVEQPSLPTHHGKEAGRGVTKGMGWRPFGRASRRGADEPEQAGELSPELAEQESALSQQEVAAEGGGAQDLPADTAGKQGSRLGRLFSGRTPRAAKQQAQEAIGAGNAAAFELAIERTHPDHTGSPRAAAAEAGQAASTPGAATEGPLTAAGLADATASDTGLQLGPKGAGMPGLGRMLSRLGSRKRQASSSPAPRQPNADEVGASGGAEQGSASHQLQKKRSKRGLSGRQQPALAADVGALQMPAPSEALALTQDGPSGLLTLGSAAAASAGALQPDGSVEQVLSSGVSGWASEAAGRFPKLSCVAVCMSDWALQRFSLEMLSYLQMTRAGWQPWALMSSSRLARRPMGSLEDCARCSHSAARPPMRQLVLAVQQGQPQQQARRRGNVA